MIEWLNEENVLRLADGKVADNYKNLYFKGFSMFEYQVVVEIIEFLVCAATYATAQTADTHVHGLEVRGVHRVRVIELAKQWGPLELTPSVHHIHSS